MAKPKKGEDLALLGVFLPCQQNKTITKAKPTCLRVKYKTMEN